MANELRIPVSQGGSAHESDRADEWHEEQQLGHQSEREIVLLVRPDLVALLPLANTQHVEVVLMILPCQQLRGNSNALGIQPHRCAALHWADMALVQARALWKTTDRSVDGTVQ